MRIGCDGEDNDMTVRRIVHTIAASDVAAAKAFYQDILDMDLIMDLGWIATYGICSKLTGY